MRRCDKCDETLNAIKTSCSASDVFVNIDRKLLFLSPEHGTSHLWGANANGGRRGWSRKRTSAPQMGNTQGSMPRIALVLRSRRSWPVAPQSYRR
ncbi:uncharacterized protein [Maniola hyperantus]|uniref:uncharacterized protein isoform X2 n=1 Tax=Aphantopus hyperantus TaxID=2795564 RepID=UPI003749D466